MSTMRHLVFALATLAVSGPAESVQKAKAAERLRALPIMMAVGSVWQLAMSIRASPAAPATEESPRKRLALPWAMLLVSGWAQFGHMAMPALRMPVLAMGLVVYNLCASGPVAAVTTPCTA